MRKHYWRESKNKKRIRALKIVIPRCAIIKKMQVSAGSRNGLWISLKMYGNFSKLLEFQVSKFETDSVVIIS